MRIAIVGGGASGLAAAWLLDAAHEVTLLEAADALGGRVRTLGGKVPCDALPPGVRLDAGVVEFDRLNFPAFHAWMAALDVATPDLPEGGATSLLLASGLRLHSPGALRVERVVCRAHVVDEVCQRVRVRGKPCAEPPREQLVGARDVERVAGDAHVVVAVGVEAHERDLARELAQDAVDGAPLADVPHVVELRVEAISTHLERVGISAGLVVRLEHDDPAPRARHQRGEGEPREPAADHDVVWFAHTLPTRRNTRSTGAVDLRGVPG